MVLMLVCLGKPINMPNIHNDPPTRNHCAFISLLVQCSSFTMSPLFLFQSGQSAHHLFNGYNAEDTVILHSIVVVHHNLCSIN